MRINPYLRFGMFAASLGANLAEVTDPRPFLLFTTTGGSPWSIGGVQFPQPGKWLFFTYGFTSTLQYNLAAEDGAATAANRFATATAVGGGSTERVVTLQVYDPVSLRWRRCG